MAHIIWLSQEGPREVFFGESSLYYFMTVHLKLKFYKNLSNKCPLNPDGLFIDIQFYYLNACYALFNFRDSESWQKFRQFRKKIMSHLFWLTNEICQKVLLIIHVFKCFDIPVFTVLRSDRFNTHITCTTHLIWMILDTMRNKEGHSKILTAARFLRN